MYDDFKRPRRVALLLAAAAFGMAVSGCTTLSTDKVQYKSVEAQRPLDLPPDLTPLPPNERFTVPGVATASGVTQAAPAPGARGPGAAPQMVVAPSAPNARIERAGAQR